MARENRDLVAFFLFTLAFGVFGFAGFGDAALVCLGVQLGLVLSRLTRRRTRRQGSQHS